MTYHNRLLTTPTYINSMDSAFWSLIAQDTSYRMKEVCKHPNYLNKKVSFITQNNHGRCIVTCKKCDHVFYATGKAMTDMVGYFGF